MGHRGGTGYSGTQGGLVTVGHRGGTGYSGTQRGDWLPLISWSVRLIE